MEVGGNQMMRRRTGNFYRIIVQRAQDKYAVAFEGMEMETKYGDTVLTGRIVDQPHSTASSAA